MNFYFIVFFYLSLFSLVSCNSSNSKEQCSIVKGTIECNGGYSYWINDIAAVSNGVAAISGVKEHKRLSQQWVGFFSDDLSQKLAEINFPLDFYADEHNAPAVLANGDGSWLVVRTGHNDAFEQGQGRLYVSKIDSEFNLVHETILSTRNGATYAQLLLANGITYLLTRDSNLGWGMFSSQDNGISWGEWKSLWLEAGHRYISMQKFGRDSIGNERILFNVGHHPSDINQKIGYLIAIPTDDGIGLITDSGIALNDINMRDEVIASLIVKSNTPTNIRFLDASNQNNNICHLYSKLNPQDNTWQLNVVAHNIDQNKKYEFIVGNYQGVLIDSTYVAGAAVGDCALSDGEQLDIFVAHQENGTQAYVIDRIYIDVQSGNVNDIEEIVRSQKQLYRPMYIEGLGYLMFNEAEYWYSYDRWEATQKVIKLP